MKILLHLTVGIFFTLVTSSCGETNTIVGPDPQPVRLGNMFEGTERNSFADAVVAAGLVDALNEPGPFTVFYPSNEAFDAMLETLDTKKEAFLARDDLTDFILNHVLDGDIGRGEFEDGTLQTLADETLTVEVREDETFVEGALVVYSSLDYEIINGNVHDLDKVLLPPGFAEAD